MVGLVGLVELEGLMLEARVSQPELSLVLETLPGRDFFPTMRSLAISSNSPQVCKILDFSEIDLGSWASGANLISISLTTPFVKLSRADSCSSGCTASLLL